MSNRPAAHGGIIIWLSFGVAFILTMIPCLKHWKYIVRNG